MITNGAWVFGYNFNGWWSPDGGTTQNEIDQASPWTMSNEGNLMAHIVVTLTWTWTGPYTLCPHTCHVNDFSDSSSAEATGGTSCVLEAGSVASLGVGSYSGATPHTCDGGGSCGFSLPVNDQVASTEYAVDLSAVITGTSPRSTLTYNI